MNQEDSVRELAMENPYYRLMCLTVMAMLAVVTTLAMLTLLPTL